MEFLKDILREQQERDHQRKKLLGETRLEREMKKLEVDMNYKTPKGKFTSWHY